MSSEAIKLVSRRVAKRVASREQAEGVGAHVWRSIGGAEVRNFDPFLLLDEFRVKNPAGFPDHPHRGFETVTYMVRGGFAHEDFVGHKGVIGPGDLQWMTAGRGIVHAEMPVGDGENTGLQLWVNLAAKDKMVPPAYQELKDADIPKPERDGVKVTVIAGTSLGVTSPVYTRTPTMYLNVEMAPGSVFQQDIPAGWNAFVYVLEGEALFGPDDDVTIGPAHNTLLLSNEPGQTGVSIRAAVPTRFVLIGGRPIGEPIVQHGTFVMNTREDIMKAMMDYHADANGFEGAAAFESSIRHGAPRRESAA